MTVHFITQLTCSEGISALHGGINLAITVQQSVQGTSLKLLFPGVDFIYGRPGSEIIFRKTDISTSLYIFHKIVHVRNKVVIQQSQLKIALELV